MGRVNFHFGREKVSRRLLLHLRPLEQAIASLGAKQNKGPSGELLPCEYTVQSTGLLLVRTQANSPGQAHRGQKCTFHACLNIREEGKEAGKLNIATR